MSNRVFRSSSFKEWTHVTDAAIAQAGAVQATWYEVLAYTGRPTHINSIMFGVTVANETVEVEVIIDGVTKMASQAAVFGSIYSVCTGGVTANTMSVSAITGMQLNLIGHNVRVRARKTTNGGASALLCKVIYAVM